jgi:hypothetical protein
MQQPWVETKQSKGEAPRWYTPTIWNMMGIRAWYRLLKAHSFRMSPAKIPTALLVTYSALIISMAGVVQSLIFGRRLKKTVIEQHPMFVIGHWRSGTTHLHELLSLDDRYAFPTTRECMTPHHCLTTERIFPLLWGWLLPKRRPMDGMAGGLDHPQEDEFALLALGVPTPMWRIAYPGATAGQPFLSLRDVSERDKHEWLTMFEKFLRLVTYRQPGKPLILKSPPHTARVRLLAKMFPNARFIHIVRDPLTVFASSVHLWRTLHSVSGMVPARGLEIESFVIECMKDMYLDFESAVAELPPNRFHQLRYEDLTTDPQTILQGCYRALDLGDFETVQPRVDEYLRKINGYQTNDYDISLAAKEVVQKEWGSIYQKWGYPL